MQSFFCIGYNAPFNPFQIISGLCLLVTDNHFIVLSHWKYHTADTVVLYPAQSHNSDSWSTSFCVDKGASTSNLKSLV